MAEVHHSVLKVTLHEELLNHPAFLWEVAPCAQIGLGPHGGVESTS